MSSILPTRPDCFSGGSVKPFIFHKLPLRRKKRSTVFLFTLHAACAWGRKDAQGLSGLWRCTLEPRLLAWVQSQLLERNRDAPWQAVRAALDGGVSSHLAMLLSWTNSPQTLQMHCWLIFWDKQRLRVQNKMGGGFANQKSTCLCCCSAASSLPSSCHYTTCEHRLYRSEPNCVINV